MIVKSMSRKSASFGQLLEYISRSEAKTFDPILHNLQTTGNEVKEIEEEFKNNSHYCRKRANGVILYHEVLALSGKDREKIDADIMNDLACKYLELRAREALAYGVIHFDHSNPHIHFMISGNLIESHRKLRLSRGDFNRIQKRLEQYQRQRYPDLEHSVVFENRGIKVRQTKQSEVERSRRLKKQGREATTQKENIRQSFLTCLTAVNMDAFLNNLREQGIELYVRGETVGIKETSTGRKYRLNTIGLLEIYRKTTDRWNKAHNRKQDILTLEAGKIHRKWKDYGFKDQILEVLKGEDKDTGNRRQDELKMILQEKRNRNRDVGLEL